MRHADLSGKTFGRLNVTAFSFSRKTPKGSNLFYWECKCDCGEITIVCSKQLSSGKTRSCGCYQKDKIVEVSTKHGQRYTKEYGVWANMLQRCTNPNSSQYEIYGAIGISVCKKWKTFDGFYEDMGECPEGMSLDRINPDGDYTKENCRWACASLQAFNTSKRKPNATGVHGVVLVESGKYLVSISKNRETFYISTEEDIISAIKLRCMAEIVLYGFVKQKKVFGEKIPDFKDFLEKYKFMFEELA